MPKNKTAEADKRILSGFEKFEDREIKGGLEKGELAFITRSTRLSPQTLNRIRKTLKYPS